MRALVWQGPYDHSVADVREPQKDSSEVLIAPALVGICGSDLTAHKGTMGISRPGAIRGHEFGGTIVASADTSLPTGTRVAVNPVVTCGQCPTCSSGEHSSCPNVQIIGVHRPGAFAELVAIPATQAHPIPDTLGWAEAASAEPLAQAIHDVELALRAGAIGRCLVIGGGTIGAWIVQVLAQSEQAEIHVVDRDVARHKLLRSLGAVQVSETIDEDAPTRFDTVFDVVGTSNTRGLAIRMARNGGQVIAVGLGSDEASIPWFDLVRREITVRGANTFCPDDYSRALEWLNSGRVSAPEQRRVVLLEHGGDVFAEMVGAPMFSGKTFVSVAAG